VLIPCSNHWENPLKGFYSYAELVLANIGVLRHRCALRYKIPYGDARRKVPVHYFKVAMIFILFDLEVVFFYPWAVLFRKLRLFGLIEMAIFILILLIGYIYVWKKGALEWE
jgi:hypothetical protein